MSLNRLREERGSIWVIAAFVVPVILLLGTFSVDVGNWFTHKRHLQTQADAAALAGGSRFQLPCTGAVNTNIVTTARQFAGPSADNNTGPYNPQVSSTPSSKLHVRLNALDFFDNGGTPQENDFSWVDTGSPSGQPCDDKFLDVKMTEKDVPWFFHLVGAGSVSRIHAEARVKLTPAIAVKGLLPIGVQLPKIYKAQATIRWCGSGGSLVPGHTEVALARLPAAMQTDPNTTLWGPDPAVYPSGTVPLAAPGQYSTCPGNGTTDFGGPDVNIEVSGSPNVTPTTGNCSNQFVDCFDTVLIRDWKQAQPPSGEQDKPGINSVQLTDVNCTPGSPYWSSDTFSTLPCTFGITANVDWGSLASKAGFTATMSATGPGGGGGALAGPGGFSGTWVGSGLKSTTAAQNVYTGGFADNANVTISWSYSWPHGGPPGPKGKCIPSAPCSGSLVVHRSQAADSSPVGKVIVTNPNTGLPLDQFNHSGFPSSIALTVGLQDTGFKPRQKEVLRSTGPQGSGALNCENDPNGLVMNQFKTGCSKYYAANTFAAGPWEPCPNVQTFPANAASAPWQCVPQTPGGQGPKIVPDGLDVATGNCDQINPAGNQCKTPACHFASQYDPSNPNQVFDPQTDKRVIKIFLVPYAGLKGLGGSGNSGAIEVAGFAAFYVTNWTGNPCAAQDNQIETVPAGADAVGHFVQIVDQGAVGDPNQTCPTDSVNPCVVVLVR